MTGWLLDTNILSELRRSRPEPKVVSFVAARKLDLLFVSSVTLAEIRFGIERVGEPERRAALTDWLALRVRPMFEGRILPVSEDVMLRWRLLVEGGRKARFTYSQPDLIIAAAALVHDLTVVTRDAQGFLRAGASVFDPWRDEDGAP